MALIKCPECGKQISDKAEECNNCGFPIDQLPIPKNDRGEQVFARGSRSKPAIATKIIIATIILVLIITGAYFVLNQDISKSSLFQHFFAVDQPTDNVQEKLVNVIPLTSDLYIGYRAKDGLGNIFRIKVKENFNNYDTSYVFLLSKWHQMGFLDIGDEKLFLIKNQKGLLEIGSKDFERLSDRFLDSLDQIVTWERDFNIAKKYNKIDFNNVFCLSDKNIVILGNDQNNDAKILCSLDGGITWLNNHYSNTKLISGDFHFNEGIVIGNSTNDRSGLIYKTTDKGESFSVSKYQNVTFISSCYGNNVFNEYYALGYVNNILKMIVIDFNDLQLISVDIPNIPSLKSICVNSGNIIFVTGASGKIYSTQKLAKRHYLPWKTKTVNNSVVLNDCYSIYSYTPEIDFIIAVGQRGTILKSNNGGKSWDKGQGDTDENLMQVSSNYSVPNFDNRTPEFYIAGNNGTILFSNDYGYHWDKQTGCSKNNLLSISAYVNNNRIGKEKEKNIAFAVGNNGTVLSKINENN